MGTPSASSALDEPPPRVLQVLPALDAGGVERTAVDVAAGLVQAGAPAFVASAGGRLVFDVERAHAAHIALPLATKNPWRLRANARHLRELIRRHGIEIVHARSRAPAWSALWAARAAGIPFVTTYAGTYNEDFPLKRRYNGVMAAGDVVIANSRFIAGHVRDRYPEAAERVVTIERGIDLRLFDPTRVTTERLIALARAWRLPDGAPVILMPGRLTRWKGQGILIDALAQLGERDFICYIVGDEQGRSTYRREIEQKIALKGLGGRVRLIGHFREMDVAYALADLVVAPSTEPEAFGRVAVEAQAMGKPIIATDHGGARETVLAGETGLLVPPGEAAPLADAIRALLDLDVPMRRAVAAHARAHVLERFGVDRMVRETLDVYKRLAYRR